MKLKHLFESHYGSLIDKDLYDSLDYADQRLYKYTADGYAPPIGETYETLEERYPFDGGTLYRGLLFSTKEKFEDFMGNIEDGKVVMNGSSSWTPSISTAIDFAQSEKTYFPTAEIMAAFSATQKAGDHMSGEGGGVVLKVTMPKGVGIDVNKSEFAKESEVILPRGTYEIEVHKVIRPYRASHDTAEKALVMADEVLQFVKTGEGDKKEIKQYATYLEKSWLDELSPAHVDAIILLHNPLDLEKMKAPASKDKRNLQYSNGGAFDNGIRITGGIHIPIDEKLYELASSKMQKRIRDYLNIQLDLLSHGVDEVVDKLEERLNDTKHPFALSTIDIVGINELELFDSTLATKAIKILKPLKQFFSKAYNHFNSREYNKTIKSGSIRDHAKMIGNIISAMSQLG